MEDATQHNALILETFNYNIDAPIRAQMESQVFCGSEFKPTHLLQELLNHYPHGEKLWELLSNRATFPVLPIDEERRIQDLIYHRDRGNHKSASKHLSQLDTIISEEISR